MKSNWNECWYAQSATTSEDKCQKTIFSSKFFAFIVQDKLEKNVCFIRRHT